MVRLCFIKFRKKKTSADAPLIQVLAASRQTFAFSRDGALPFSGWLYRMNSYTGTPVNTVSTSSLLLTPPFSLTLISVSSSSSPVPPPI